MEIINLPIEITGEFENPELISIEYDAVTSTFTLDWGNKRVWYYQDNLLVTTPNSFDVFEISIINSINEDTVSLSSLNCAQINKWN